MSGATGRLWVNANGGRLELQSDAGDAQIVWNKTKVTVYDASSNTAYTADLPQDTSDDRDDTGTARRRSTRSRSSSPSSASTGPSPAPTRRTSRGQEAYTVTVSPKHDGGLLGSAELAWDAMHGVPLKVAVYAQGRRSPVLALEATNISFGAVPDSDVAVAPPAGAKVVDLSSQAHDGGTTDGSTPPVTGLAAVQAAAPFTVVAPDTLVGLPRQDVRLVGPATRRVLAVYGQGLGAIVVVERAPDAAARSRRGAARRAAAGLARRRDRRTSSRRSSARSSRWDSGGVSYVLAGSVPAAAAEAAARALK